MTSNNPLVSIIVPVYKVEPFLNNCVSSIINQTYSNIEVILVDDGSPDNCPKICDELATNDARIKVIHKKNGGVTWARIDGVKNCKGDFISFVDSDDSLNKNAIEELIKCALKYNTNIVVCQTNIIFEGEKNLTDRYLRLGYYSKENIVQLLNDNFLFDNRNHLSGFPLYLWGKLFKKDLLTDKLEKGIGFWYGEDMVTMFSILKDAESMYITDKALYNYFQNNSQVTRKPIDILFPQYLKVWQYFEKEDTDSYFKTQLPQRMWWVILSEFAANIRQHTDFHLFKSLFIKIRQTPIIERQLLNPKLLEPLTLKHRILHFLFRMKWTKLYFYLIKKYIGLKSS